MVGNFLLARLRDREFSAKHYGKHKSMYHRLRSQLDMLRTTRFVAFSKKQLIASYTGIVEDLMKYHALSFDVDAIDIVFDHLREPVQWSGVDLVGRRGKCKGRGNAGIVIGLIVICEGIDYNSDNILRLQVNPGLGYHCLIWLV